MMTKITGNKEFFLLLLFCLGYLTLVGPPRAISMKKKIERKSNSELYGEPLCNVLIVELALRGSIFILMAVGVESLVGNEVFEKLYGDETLVGLMICGLIHIISYYIGLVVIAPRDNKTGMLLYRLGRNGSYSLFMGILSVCFVLFYQYVNQIKIIKTDIVVVLISISIIFLIIGIIESILKVNKIPSTIDL